MSIEERKFDLYLTVLRFLAFKITNNLKRIYLDFDLDNHLMTLMAIYENEPSEYELELFDDIVTNSHAHIPFIFVDQTYKLRKDIQREEKHEFVVFATHDQI